MKTFLFVLFLVSISAFADESAVNTGRIDGVPVEAVEAFPVQKPHEIELGAGIYPFNAYNYGLAIGGGYTYHFNDTYAWEILHADQYFSVEKGLTAELADKYQVNPQTIEKLRYDFASNLAYTVANGKFSFLKDSIRYFRTVLLVGPGIVNTDQRTNLALSFGASFEFFTGDQVAWKFEARDCLPVGGITNILTFSLGSGIHF